MSEFNGKQKHEKQKTNKQKRFSLFLMSNNFIHEALSDVYTKYKKNVILLAKKIPGLKSKTINRRPFMSVKLIDFWGFQGRFYWHVFFFF